MIKDTKNLLEFWETQMKQSHRSSNYFFRKSPSHYHMMLLVMSAHKNDQELSVEELKTKLFKTSRPKSAIIITEAVDCLLYTSPSPRDVEESRMPSSA